MASMPTALRENEGKTRRDRQLEYVLLRFLSAAAASGFPDIRSRLLVSAPPPSFSRRGAALSRTLVSLSLCPPRSSSPPSRQPHPWAIGNFHCTDGAGVCRFYSLFFLGFPAANSLFLACLSFFSASISIFLLLFLFVLLCLFHPLFLYLCNLCRSYHLRLPGFSLHLVQGLINDEPSDRNGEI